MGNFAEQLSKLFDVSKPTLNIKICFGDLAPALTNLKFPHFNFCLLNILLSPPFVGVSYLIQH